MVALVLVVLAIVLVALVVVFEVLTKKIKTPESYLAFSYPSMWVYMNTFSILRVVSPLFFVSRRQEMPRPRR